MPKMRALVIEDDELVRGFCRTVLRGIADVLCVATTEEGLENLRKKKFDFVLLDLILPNGAGMEVVDKFQAASPGTPIVAMSAGEYELREVYDAGAQEFLKKPMTPEQMLSAVIRAVARHRTRRDFKPVSEAAGAIHEELRSGPSSDADLAPGESTDNLPAVDFSKEKR
jgi:DNA-binding response OmpR family regulator